MTGQRCGRLYGKIVGSELTALNAPKVLGKLPDITFWACNILMEDRREIVSSKLSKGKDASSGRWTNVAYAKQVVGRPVSNCALRILHQCTKCGFMSKDDSMFVRSHNSRTRSCCAYCGAPSEHESGNYSITMQYGDEEDSCMVFQAGYPLQGNCMSVVKALIAANNVHQEEVSSHQVGSHRMVFGGPWSHTHGGIGSTMEGMK